jgi:hypothetical protein
MRIRYWKTVVTGLVVLGVAVTPGGPAKADGSSGLPPGVSMNSIVIDSIAQQIDALGQSASEASIYGGVVETDEATHIDVYLTDDSVSAEEPFLALSSIPDAISFV